MNQEMTKDQLEQYYERSAQIIDRDSFYSPDLYTNIMLNAVLEMRTVLV